MPNHVKIELTFAEYNEETKRLIERYTTSRPGVEDALAIFPDFEKVLPIPEEIKASRELIVQDKLAFDFLMLGDTESWKRLLRSSRVHNLEQALKYVKLFRKYGVINSNDWVRRNWGTKWNSYEHRRVSELVYRFQTAWSFPDPIFARLVEEFPTVAFSIRYADEDIGSNCGSLQALGDGELIEDDMPVNPREFALSVWERTEEDYD